MVIVTILFIYYQRRWQNGKRGFSTTITIATLKFFSCCFLFIQRACMSTTRHSFVNDGSEHSYIYICDKREETVEREEGKKSKKEKKKIIQKGTLLTQGHKMNNGYSCLSSFFLWAVMWGVDVPRLLVKRVSLDFQVYNRSLNMIDKKVRNAWSYHLFFPLSEFYWSLFIVFLIASMHTHAQEICYYDDLLCFFLFLSISTFAIERQICVQGLCDDEQHIILSICAPESI
jgi:hypothetical protein